MPIVVLQVPLKRMDEVRREEEEREGFVWYVVTAVKMC